MIDERILKREEKAVLALRSLYRSRGYLPYKMSKFEEFEFYMKNKDFLVSDRIIAFNDTNGRLMALKPDVTLSIVKHGEDERGCKQKVYYDENVYRVSDSTGQFRELRQVGLECIGDVDLYDVYEAVSLGAQSLGTISEQFVLEVSHLGVLSEVLEEICSEDTFQREALRCIGEKNSHELWTLCETWGLSEKDRSRLLTLVSVYGERRSVLASLEEVCREDSPARRELAQLSRMLDGSPFGDRIFFDFSVVNDMSYYNGIVFKGYVSGISQGVLSGGRYDKLMAKLGRSAGAVGFALYLDLLEQLPVEKRGVDVDVLLLYTETDDPACVERAVRRLTAKGRTVSAQRGIPRALRAGKVITLGKEEELC